MGRRATDAHRTASASDLLAIFQEAYSHEPLIHVGKEPPVVKDNSGKHHVAIGGARGAARWAVGAR